LEKNKIFRIFIASFPVAPSFTFSKKASLFSLYRFPSRFLTYESVSTIVGFEICLQETTVLG